VLIIKAATGKEYSKKKQKNDHKKIRRIEKSDLEPAPLLRISFLQVHTVFTRGTWEIPARAPATRTHALLSGPSTVVLLL
jgi:hypothetical protein